MLSAPPGPTRCFTSRQRDCFVAALLAMTTLRLSLRAKRSNLVPSPRSLADRGGGGSRDAASCGDGALCSRQPRVLSGSPPRGLSMTIPVRKSDAACGAEIVFDLARPIDEPAFPEIERHFHDNIVVYF